jgi:hypothetical protein
MLHLQTDTHIASQNIHANIAPVILIVSTVSAVWCKQRQGKREDLVYFHI